MTMGRPKSTSRKRDHLRIAAGPRVVHRAPSGLAAVRMRHRGLPGRDLGAVALDSELFGHGLRAPLLVSAMTGGVAEAAMINARLTRAAAVHGVAMTLGSGRALLEDPSLLRTYVGACERPPLLLANLGAVQVAAPDGPAAAERLVGMLGADGLVVHLNPIQEAVQPEGQPRFAGVLEGIAAVVRRLAPLPVVAKEVGFGLDPADVALLGEAGVAGVDVAGAGGTNWALVEGGRDRRASAVASAFGDWGVSTMVALEAARDAGGGLPVIASGGLRDGVDVAKCLALGASAAGLARVLLIAAQADRAGEVLGTIVEQLRIAAWAAGAARADELGPEHLQPRTPT
jgi:isopentenyl-diphosphate delta-isomerase